MIERASSVPAGPLCPVCPDARRLVPYFAHGTARVPLERCPAEHGLWGRAAALREALRELPQPKAPPAEPLRDRCRGCGAHLGAAGRCPSCGATHSLRCPGCRRRLERVRIGTFSVDVCLACRGAWLDRGEFEAVVARGRIRLFESLESSGTASERAGLPATAGAFSLGPDEGTSPWIFELGVELLLEGLSHVFRDW